jgi:hypothetical protein
LVLLGVHFDDDPNAYHGGAEHPEKGSWIYFQYILKESQIGNIMFWISFCIIGQPSCLFIYYQLYVNNQ